MQNIVSKAEGGLLTQLSDDVTKTCLSIDSNKPANKHEYYNVRKRNTIATTTLA